MFSRVVNLSKCILNSHVPPFGTLLDRAFSMYSSSFSLDRHVGSKAVRKAISRYQPLVGLHGHVHESPGVDYIGRTTLFNPGSKYESGQLGAVRVTLEGDKVHSYQFFDE
jgi:Icc-related predicted phosphoesterase